jgi:hypothetical protein
VPGKKTEKSSWKANKCIVVHAKSEVCCKDTGTDVDYYKSIYAE